MDHIGSGGVAGMEGKAPDDAAGFGDSGPWFLGAETQPCRAGSGRTWGLAKAAIGKAKVIGRRHGSYAATA
jgi:hypothetical protein